MMKMVADHYIQRGQIWITLVLGSPLQQPLTYHHTEGNSNLSTIGMEALALMQDLIMIMEAMMQQTTTRMMVKHRATDLMAKGPGLMLGHLTVTETFPKGPGHMTGHSLIIIPDQLHLELMHPHPHYLRLNPKP